MKVEPEKLYQEIGIYCFGRGIFHQTPRTGLEVGDKDLFLMKEGDFILQVTFAWEGAIAPALRGGAAPGRLRRCSSVTAPKRGCSLLAPCIRPGGAPAKTGSYFCTDP